MERPPRAVVTDDSHFMRSVISDILEAGNIEVVAEARTGREAVEAVHEHHPDVVTMDVEMPDMDGIEAVDRIMTEEPTPILMLSAYTEEDADVTFEALEAGAVDFFGKPGGEVSMEMSRFEDQLVEMVSNVACVDPTGATPTPDDEEATRETPEYPASPTLVIGSSTGGPKMVETLLTELPLSADLRVLVVQHMPDGFTSRFAERIDARSDYDVREAADGERIGAGEALIAQGGKHLVVDEYEEGRLGVRLTEDSPVNSVRPAVDVTMESAAREVSDPLIGVILSGMGEDGAAGIQAIKAVGGRTLAQDRSSSAVFGMPKRAIETGCVDEVLSINELPQGIANTASAEVN